MLDLDKVKWSLWHCPACGNRAEPAIPDLSDRMKRICVQCKMPVSPVYTGGFESPGTYEHTDWRCRRCGGNLTTSEISGICACCHSLVGELEGTGILKMDPSERIKYHWYDIVINGDQFHQQYQSLAHALTDTALMKLDETDVVSVKRADE